MSLYEEYADIDDHLQQLDSNINSWATEEEINATADLL